ncbi:hypothetical protein GWK47_034060 [Chionoecetes opilio]|uniref:Uncharacterized protein n=1 Tax=Chionoecetes opilio TaxID=41210 RepID=A0A8J4YJ99_CHIOP|nr:hypothetical protein GWK47_034060 [Chionoecetes opilio]
MSCCVTAGTSSSQGETPLALTPPGQWCAAPGPVVRRPRAAGVQWLRQRGVGGTVGRKVILLKNARNPTFLTATTLLGDTGLLPYKYFFYSQLTCLRQSVARTEAPASPSLQCGKFCKPSRDSQTSQGLQQRTRMQHVTYP